ALSKGVLVLTIIGLAVLYLVYESNVADGRTVPILTPAIEKAKRLSEKKIAQSPFMMGIGVLITVLIFPLMPAAAGLMQLAFSDMAAAMIGLLWGRHPLPHSPKKSWEGTGAFFIMALFLMPLIGYSIPASFLLALVGATVESLPYKDWDNLFIPVGVAAIASFF
ncbi:MAG: phosphatidate cytidylyltransferase, partial [Deltaproteobacteria bacterium]|nr:phosphatidate cytidylyltransferase [Deltaproteobacteria bacterium]